MFLFFLKQIGGLIYKMIKVEKIHCIEQWKNIILSGDSSKLTEIIDENAIFYSPVVYTPQVGKKKVIHYLSNAVKVFQNKDFNYIKTIKKDLANNDRCIICTKI